jgi:hypothetical protein
VGADCAEAAVDRSASTSGANRIKLFPLLWVQRKYGAS